ncbi:MAG: hypothetical protein ABIG46_04275 [Candidatus Omnitrophota bacterium]
MAEEALKLWQKKSEATTIQANPKASPVRESVYCCAPSDDPWFVLYKLSKPFFFTAFQVELAI